MIALDTNILIHFLNPSQNEHEKVKTWFAKNTEPLATTHTNLAEVLRLITHPQVFQRPASLNQAITSLKSFLEYFSVAILKESDTWWEDLQELVHDIPTLKGNEIFDARIALCLRYHGVKEIFTFDSDFAKYRFLKMVRI